MPDRYEKLDEIGSGGMGVVYRARDQRLDRIVAIKELREGLIRDVDAKRRFQREAKALARLDHPAIVHVYDVGIRTGVPFLVMSYVDGISLRDHIARCGTLSTEETAQLGIRLAEGLSHAHDMGVLHRDLKPGNVLLKGERFDVAVVADFGIAHLLERTTTATRVGTPGYMSPEQLNGDDLDERSDVYGLGAVLYECVSSNPLYGRGDMRQVLYRMIKENRRRLDEGEPSAPAWLVEVVERCIAEKPESRYKSADAVAEELRKGKNTGHPLSDAPYEEGLRLEKASKNPSHSTMTFSRHATGTEVRLIQRFLTSCGYDLGEAGVDGVYGADTEDAVRSFQHDNALPMELSGPARLL
jgi:serine/threonine protein kinase